VRIAREDERYVLTAEQWLPVPRDELFSFFADATNLERITPDLLRFRIASPLPIEMRRGATIDYRLRVRGVPMRWRSEITVWEPPVRFVDFQLRGPYRLWNHEHRFEEHRGGTLCRDRVEYRVPGGPLAPLLHALFVRGDVERIFRHRQRVLDDLFGRPRDGGATAPR
jgi:ligand-binding SRPBCC domain-containing protein